MVLEAARPVGGLANIALGEHFEEILDVLFGDGPAHADFVGLVDRHREGHLAVGHAEHEIFGFLTECLALLFLLDHGRSVVGVHHSVTRLEAHRSSVLEVRPLFGTFRMPSSQTFANASERSDARGAHR